MSKIKKVLIIGNFWPYTPFGSKRILSLAKFLPDYGWEPRILTQQLREKPDKQFKVIETDYQCFLGKWVKFLGLKENEDLGEQLRGRFESIQLESKSWFRFFYRTLREILAYPDEYKNWKPFAIGAARDIFQKEKIDALISVYPLTSHIIADELKRKYEIPWIADLTDLWSDNSAYIYSNLRKFIDKKLELKTLTSADILTTSSPPLAERLKKLHKRNSVFTIWLGFDAEIFDKPLSNPTPKFTITYTGFLYPKKRDPTKFFAVISKLLSDGKIDSRDIEVRFFSPIKKETEEKIKKYRLSGVVKQYEMIPLKECINKQRESQILLQLNWEDPKEKGVFSGKLFDYLAARRPILAAGGAGKDEVVKEILTKTHAGVYASSIDEIEHDLFKFYMEYKQKGKIEYRGKWEEVEKFSTKKSTKKFGELLNQITEKKP